MGRFNQEDFNRFVLNNNVIGFFEQPIKLNSGRMSNWYVNWRTVSEDVFLLDRLTEYVIAFTKSLGLEPDSYYGVPEGATKLGLFAQFRWAKESPSYAPNSHVLPMGRGKPKDHGAPKDRYFLGAPRGKTIVLEDVATTGGSLLATIDNIGPETPIIAAFGLTNRMELRDDGQSVKQAVESRNVPYHSLSDALLLLPEAYKKLSHGSQVARAIEEEFERYGVEKLRLR